MNAHTLDALRLSTAGSLDGTLSFPQTVATLMEVGVSHYQVDLLRREKTIYLRTGESHVEELPLPEQPIASRFSETEVAAAVKASQTEGQSYPEFVRRVREAGCIGYVAYLDGRRVVYTGWSGEQHIELFPRSS